MDSITIEIRVLLFLSYVLLHVNIWLTSKRYSLWMASFINIKYASSFLVCLMFLYVLCFCCCLAFILWEQSTTSLLAYLGQLTPGNMTQGWSESLQMPQGEEEAPYQRNEQELRAFWVMKNTFYCYLLNWKMMGFDVLFAGYHLVTACLRNR